MIKNDTNPQLSDLFNQEEEAINKLPPNFSKFTSTTFAEWELEFNYSKKVEISEDPENIVFCQAFNKRISKCF